MILVVLIYATAASEWRIVEIHLWASVGWKQRLPASLSAAHVYGHAKCDGVYRKDIFTIQWLCSQLWHVTVANQRTIVEIKLLATVARKRGCQPFSCPCSLKCDPPPKGDLFDRFVSGVHSCLSFWDFQVSTPYQKLEVSESGSTLDQFLCIMVASCPSLRCICRKNAPISCKEAEPFGHAVVVSSKICDKCSDCHSQLFCVTASNQGTLVEIELLAFFATVAWKWGCQRFSWRCSLNVTHRRKETCSTGLFQESIPAKFLVFFFARTFNSWRDQRVGKSGLLSWESQFSSNARVLNQW